MQFEKRSFKTLKRNGRHFFYDFRVGTLQAWKLNLGMFLFFLLSCVMMASEKSALAEYCGEKISFLDLMGYFFEGQRAFAGQDSNMFEMPFYWFLFFVGGIILIVRYPKWDYEEHGYQYFIRAGRKTTWWYSKCLWCMAEAFLYCLMIVGILGIATALHEGSLIWSSRSLVGCGLENLNALQMWMAFAIVPYLTLVSLVMAGVVISMWSNVLVAFVCCLAMLVAEVYWNIEWLPGEYSMFRRMAECSNITGWYGTAIGINVVCIVLCVVVGRLNVKKREVQKYGSSFR